MVDRWGVMAVVEGSLHVEDDLLLLMIVLFIHGAPSLLGV